MHSANRMRGWVWLLAASTSAVQSTGAGAAIIKTLDRPFPVGQYCPLESRASSGADLSFVAPAATIRLTFSAINKDASDNWNAFRVDNVAVVLKSVFDANQVSPSPGFENCYDPSPPPGQATGGDPNVPSYNFNASGTPEVLHDRFDSGITDWTGSHLYFDAASTAPTDPATGTGFTGGSLGLGLSTDGMVSVSASRIISGLTPGQSYVVFAWWHAAETNPLTIEIGVPCADQDGDGFVICSICDLKPGETCGDCNDSNPHCGSSCADQDSDGWCAPLDCDESAPTCTGDCVADADLDGVPDCRDGCLDADRDGYGEPAGGASTCLGADCAELNPWCNVSCVDADGDGHCAPGDCQDSNPNVANGIPEVNDFLDQNCPGERGYGIADEISGESGFFMAGNTSAYSWPHQAGGLGYLAVRSSSSGFPAGCASFTTSTNSITDASAPPPGGGYFYLVRALTTAKGSWGQEFSGAERAVICGAESDCDNGLDDDADAATDCADADCDGTAACRALTFAFTDTTDDDIADDALYQFFQSVTAGPSDYILFELEQGTTRTASWCSVNAEFYRTQYLALAPTFGSVMSGGWNKWRKAPSTGDAWQGPDVTAHLNTFGDDCFGTYSWCSEQFAFEPQNSIFPNRTNDCEIYDLSTGACGASTGETYRMTISIASTRALACGF